MKKFVCLLTLLTAFFLLSNAQAAPILTNLLANSSFENTVPGFPSDFVSWSEGGEWYKDGRAHTGSFSARLGVQTGNLYQSFVTPGPADTLLFGAFFKIITNSYVSDWDQAQINMQVAGLPDTTIGGSITNFGVGFVQNPTTGLWESDWFEVGGSVNVSAVGLANSAINISMQNFDTETTRLLVDDAYAGEPVPEPATMLLFGIGLSGLAGLRKRRKMRG